MPRFLPPHLMALVALLGFVLWVMLVHHFRNNGAVQEFLAETIGDDTPENALSAFESARARLERHLEDTRLDPSLRQRIEQTLALTSESTATHAENCLT